jgi:hypothetical protein
MSEVLKVQAQVPEKKNDKGEVTQKQLGPITINVNTGATAAEMIQLFGDEAVKSNADANWVVTLQSNIRAGLKKGETQEAIQARLGGAKMGVAAKGAVIDPKEAFMAMYAAATPERRQQLIAELTAKVKK